MALTLAGQNYSVEIVGGGGAYLLHHLPIVRMWPNSYNASHMTRPRGWIIASIVATAVAFWWGPLRFIIYAGPGDVPTSHAVALSVWLGWIWIAIFLGSLFFAKWRALWLPILAPFALYWPAMWIFVGHACDLLGRCS
jgi:hypothetical protein